MGKLARWNDLKRGSVPAGVPKPEIKDFFVGCGNADKIPCSTVGEIRMDMERQRMKV